MSKIDLGEARGIRESAQAVLVRLVSGPPKDWKEKWIPKSVIHDDSEIWQSGQHGKCVVEYWWAEKEGLV